MGRIFTYGCSFTDYCWPTWADMLLYKNEGLNLAISGGGAEQILHRLISTDMRYSLTKDDIVIIVFPSLYRHDLIQNNDSSWAHYGQVTNTDLMQYEGKLFTLDGCAYRNLNAMLAIQNYLLSKKINFLFGSLGDMFYLIPGVNYSKDIVQHKQYVKSKIDFKLKSFSHFLSNGDKDYDWVVRKKFGNYLDVHPRPTEHFKWLNEELGKYIDLNLKVSNDDLKMMEKYVDIATSIKECNDFFQYKTRYLDNKVSSHIYFEVPDKNKKTIDLI
jgi:hypothetical protein